MDDSGTRTAVRRIEGRTPPCAAGSEDTRPQAWSVHAERNFLADRGAPAVARAWIRAILGAWDAVEAIPDVLTVGCELVTNAVQWGEGPIVLHLDRGPDRVRVAVFDAGPGTVRPASPGGDQLRGRGLRVVNALSLAWGVEHGARGKTVWADLALVPFPPAPWDVGPGRGEDRAPQLVGGHPRPAG